MSLPTGYALGADGITIWNPIPNVYSPPILHGGGIKCYKIKILEEHLNMMGLIIGREGYHFKRITHLSMSLYIFFKKEAGEIEVWGNDAAITRAHYLLSFHIYKILQIHYYQEGFDHLPMGLRPLRVQQRQMPIM